MAAAILSPRLHVALSRRALRVVSDERLVAEVRRGNRNAFEAVYDRHHAGILAFSRHMLGSREESEDVVQHTFIAAYQTMLADERDIALKAWLYAIARNRCVSVLRARREHVELDDADARIPTTAGLSAEVEQREDLRALLADLQGLPEEQRAALILAELGAHSHEEIAHILGVPTPKIKALVFQARQALMSRREARDADCGAIREQLSVLRGGARRRGELRHHIAQCEGCRAFDAEVRVQRAGFAVLLPVVPALALKQSSLLAAFTAGGGGGAAAAGGGAVAAGGGAAVGGGAAAGGGAAGGGGVAGATAVGTTAAGGAAAGGAAVVGGTAAGGTAAGGAAAVGGATAGGAAVAGGVTATGIGGSAVLTTGGAVLGAKVMGVKALTALALTGAVSSGGYAAVQQLPGNQEPAPRTQSALVQRDQPQKQGPKTPLGAVVVPADSQDCRKQPAGATGCPKKPAPDSRPMGRPLSDPGGEGAANGIDKCPRRPASATGCPATAPAPTTGPTGTTTTGPTTGTGAADDRDGDGVPDAQDNCPTKYGTVNGCPDPAAASSTTPKPPRGDRDGDGIPNAKDDDKDGDGFPNSVDMCPTKYGTVNGCPAPAATDPTATVPLPGDRDGDGIPNAKDDDIDGDGFLNVLDACPKKSGPGTADGCPPSATGPMGDRDGDGIPNSQDPDRDGDDVPNGQDACPNRPGLGNPDGCPPAPLPAIPPPPPPPPPPPTADPTTTTTVPAPGVAP